MIQLNPSDLKRSDIGREFKVKNVVGKLANFSFFKNHVEIVFEDGGRHDVEYDGKVIYDDEVEVRLTCEEIKLLMEHHPEMKQYRVAKETYEHRRALYYGRSWEDRPTPPNLPERIRMLSAVYKNKVR